MISLFICCVLTTVTSQKLTIIHTTDIHGWINGHSHNATLNANLGDYLSFLHQFVQKTLANGDDVLIFDSGDLQDGTGLSDATPIKGTFIYDSFAQLQPYWGLTIGNHDIEHEQSVAYLLKHFVPLWKGHYITSNTRVKLSNRPIGNNFKVVATASGGNVLMLGYLFNFKQNANTTTVVPLQQSLGEKYFAQAMAQPNIDLIVVMCHIDPQTPPDINQLHAAIRSYKPTTPLVFLTGHAHRYFYAALDANCVVIESGKYFESLGMIEALHWKNNSGKNFAQRATHQWLPTSTANFAQLLNQQTLQQTQQGKQLTQSIEQEYNNLGLNATLGCLSMTYSPYVSLSAPDSLCVAKVLKFFAKQTAVRYALYMNTIVPTFLYDYSLMINQTIITNTEMLRSPAYKGRVSENALYEIDPFNSTYLYYPALTGVVIDSVIGYLNQQMPSRGPIASWIRCNAVLTPWQSYAVLCTEYDCNSILMALRAVEPTKTFAYQAYTKSMTDTLLLKQYFESQKCSK